MIEDGAALFDPEGDHYIPTVYAQGPWDPGAQFGGSPAALLVTLVERVPTLVPMSIARFSADLLRPVPMSPLTADVEVVREGKVIQVVAFSLRAGGVEVTRGSALRIRQVGLSGSQLLDGRTSNPLPEMARPVDEEIFPVATPHGSRRAVEYLFEDVGGYFNDPAWVRLKTDVIRGEPASPIARLVYTSDLASGVGMRGRGVTGINADLSVNVVRYPEGEWLCLEGRGWVSANGIGQSQATLSDHAGVVAAISMARVILPSGALPHRET